MNFKKVSRLIFGILLIPSLLYAVNLKKKNIDLVSRFSHNAHTYLYTYYTGDGSDGLHLMYSQDGLFWNVLNNGKAILKPEIGSEKLMRDPSIIQDNEGIFHMVWATGINDKGIGYAASRDLINWSSQKEIPVMANEASSKNVWAPELFYDKSSKTYYILWSSTVSDRFPAPTETANDYNNRIYYTTTKDFETYSKAELFYDPGFSANDPFLIKEGSTYHLLLTKESESPIKKEIHLNSSKKITKYTKTETEAISAKQLATGAVAQTIGKYTYIYWINSKENTFGAIRSKNIKKAEWIDISDILRIPSEVKQGSILKINDEFLTKLQVRYK